MVMYSALLCSLLKVYIVVCELQFFILIANAQKNEFLRLQCPNTTTYNQNSTYQANLRSLLSDLSSNGAAKKMFYNATAGNSAPDVIYGLVLCRGDLTVDACHECLQTATTDIVSACPQEKETYIWYDNCMLRYNNESFFGSMTTSPSFSMWNVKDVSNPDRLDDILGDVMNRLIDRVSGTENVDHLKGFATGESNFTSLLRLYNLVQCTPDISSFECNQCLITALGQIRADTQGARILSPSCNIRYETYPFYNSTVASLAPPPPSTPPPAPSSPPPLPPPPPPAAQVPDDIDSGGKGGLSAAVIAAIIVPIVVSIVLFIMGFCFLRKKAKKQQNGLIDMAGDVDGNEISAAESLQYDLNFIRVATNNFSADNKIGEGGFGEVFKGILNTGQQIAVKRLSKSSGQGGQEFKNEFLLLTKLQHRNLVKLQGYCLDEGEKILVYEFVPNKSLDFILFEQEKQHSLDWSRRYKIIGGVAKGILYLHEDSRLRIIHRDLKASNVLLDSDMNAKISDFGIARLVGIDESQVNTSRVVGTLGYMSPEYALHGQFSVKSDVFSFGVLVLEIISGKKNASFNQSENSDDLLSYAWKLWRDGRLLDLMDPILGDTFVRNEVIRCIEMALLCVQEDPEDRPTMASVVHMISSYPVTLPLPQQPAMFLRSRMTMSKQPDSGDFSNNSKSLPQSENEELITELYPR